jgi:hypothetical protein
MAKKTTVLSEQTRLGWRIHTGRLLQEILTNPGTAILYRPLQILGALLAEVGERAAELNDPKLNALMTRLTIYSVADPDSPDYDPKVVEEILKTAEREVISIDGVNHTVLHATDFDYHDKKTIEGKHPFGTVYVRGDKGYVANGHKWLEFDLADLGKFPF